MDTAKLDGATAVGRPSLVIVVSPIKITPGHFQASFECTGEVLVGASRQPFVDAARVPIKNGHPYAVLLMKHAGTDIVALMAPLAKAAKLGVEEGPHGPRFVQVRTGPRTRVAAPPISPSAATATSLPETNPLTGAPGYTAPLPDTTQHPDIATWHRLSGADAAVRRAEHGRPRPT
jgi:hypothetical protein